MQLKIVHLVYEYWTGPAIGLRMKMKRQTAGIVIRIPHKLSRFLLWLERREP